MDDVSIQRRAEVAQTSPWLSNCVPGDVQTSNSLMVGDAHVRGTAGFHHDWTIQSRDRYGNDLITGGSRNPLPPTLHTKHEIILTRCI